VYIYIRRNGINQHEFRGHPYLIQLPYFDFVYRRATGSMRSLVSTIDITYQS